MSEWWDSEAGRYRTTLPHKLFHVWGWPLIRWVMFQLPSETAHHLALRGIWLTDIIETLWWSTKLPLAICALLVIFLEIIKR